VSADETDTEQSSEKRSEVVEAQSEAMMQSADCTPGMWTTLSVYCLIDPSSQSVIANDIALQATTTEYFDRLLKLILLGFLLTAEFMLLQWSIRNIAVSFFVNYLHFACVIDDAKCIVVTRVCVSVCPSVRTGGRTDAHTTARTRM